MPLTTRSSAIAALVMLPALVAAASLVAVEGLRLVSPDAPLFGGPPPATLAAAITRRYGVEHVYAFIQAGQDPNALVRVEDPNDTGGGQVTVPPLIAAIAARDSTVVQMLLDYGARLELEQHHLAACFARALGDEEVAALIARRAPDPPAVCPNRPIDLEAPLTWFTTSPSSPTAAASAETPR